MKPATKRTASIVGVSALSIGLLVGTGFAANAATTGITTALHQASSVTPTSTSTPTPVRTQGPRHHDVNDNDADDNDANDDNGRDANEHANPEPGDDDAPGTPDHHGAHRGPGKAPAPAPAPNGGSGHHGNENNGHGGSGHDGAGHDANDND